jgi:hypothetical protein
MIVPATMLMMIAEMMIAEMEMAEMMIAEMEMEVAVVHLLEAAEHSQVS